MIGRVVPGVELFKHFNRALRWPDRGQLERVFVQMVSFEVLDKLTLVAAQRVRGHESENASRPDKVENVNLS